MRQLQETLAVATNGQGFTDMTADISAVVHRAGITTGLCHLFLRHTSASLIVQENADPDVRRDLATYFAKIAPESPSYRHQDEGPDDMPAHIRAVLTQTSLAVPVGGGKLMLGTWQAVYLWEHRRAAHTRQVVVHIAGT